MIKDDLTPKDENLRLVLSGEHTAWLDAQISKTKRGIATLFVIVILGVAGSYAAGNILSDWYAHTPECSYMAAESVQPGEAVDPTDPCASADAGLTPPILAAEFVILAVIISLVAFIELFRNISKLKDYRSFTGDHQEFLEKYHRP